MSNIYTTEEYSQKKKKESQQEQFESISSLAATAGIGYVGISYGNRSEDFRNFFSSLPGANRYSAKNTISRMESIAGGSTPIDVSDLYKSQSVGRSLNSMISSIEELSPLSLLKTLQGSNVIEPFTSISPAQASKSLHITPDALEAFSELYNAQITKQSKGKRSLTATDLKRGFMLQDGILYAIKPDGSIDYVDPALRNVKLVTSNVKVGDHYSPNKILEKYANIYNVNLQRTNYQASNIVALGSNSKTSFAKDWMSSYFRYAMEIGYKSMDNPLGGVEELLSATGVGQTSILNSPAYKAVKSKLNINLGTNNDYTLSTIDSLKVMSKNVAVKSLAAYIGYNAVDGLLSTLTPETSVWNNGLLSGIAATYANTRIGAAKLLADPFQGYKEAQEEAAEGSTNLSTLIGLPLVGAMAGASYEYYKRMYLSGSKGIEAASSQAAQEVPFRFFDSQLKSIGFKDSTPMKSKAVMGGAIGSLLALPFLPGALIGESSERLKEEYSGDTLVENRTNAGWIMGGTKFEGENVKNFQSSWVARTVLDVKNEVRYGGSDEKRNMDPILNPFKYISNPYRYEQMHQEDSPYPVWGMDVNYGSFLGKAFQATAGEIIKPTVINEEFIKQMNEQSKFNAEAGVVGATGFGIGGQGSTAYSIPMQVRPKERSLIDDGLMMAPKSPSNDPLSLNVSNINATIGDFTGAKGFAASLGVKALGFNPEDSGLQLARSGTSTSVSQDLKEANLGDLGGLGEFVRRIIPHTSSTSHDYINPMENKIAPNWMPSDSSRYYNNFRLGDYWSKVDNGEARLAGLGFNLLNPELKDMNPDRYPLVYKYRILSDTAYASPEHLSMKDQILQLDKENKLNDEERDIFYRSLEQEQIRGRKREFKEYKTQEEFSKLSLSQKLLNTIWDPITHNSESVLEPLTPFRPGAKFIHARSAIEDYEKTQLQGPDTGIWTNPYSHFIKPAINRTVGLLPGTQVPDEAKERDSVDEYFDKLAYLKARKEGNTNAALRTVIGSTFGGIYDTSTMNKFRAGLTADQRLYVDAFASETDPNKRAKILEMLPSDVSVAYQSIWENLEVAESAKRKGRDVEAELMAYYTNKTDKFVKAAGGTTQKYATTPRNPDDKFEKARERRLQAADKVAEEYIRNTTGVPDNNWIGWDPRISAKDLKLRTLTIGKADVFRHGYWDSDVERNERITALDSSNEVVGDYKRIRNALREERSLKNRMEDALFRQGFHANRIELTAASRNDVVIRDNS